MRALSLGNLQKLGYAVLRVLRHPLVSVQRSQPGDLAVDLELWQGTGR
jgi:hypothetical protein